MGFCIACTWILSPDRHRLAKSDHLAQEVDRHFVVSAYGSDVARRTLHRFCSSLKSNALVAF